MLLPQQYLNTLLCSWPVFFFPVNQFNIYLFINFQFNIYLFINFQLYLFINLFIYVFIYLFTYLFIYFLFCYSPTYLFSIMSKQYSKSVAFPKLWFYHSSVEISYFADSLVFFRVFSCESKTLK